jgi:TetR/AcrR family transcriptional regulator
MVNTKLNDTTEQKILSAARKVFIAKGMAGARMHDIADEAGINKALLHYYFGNKEKLFETIFLEASQDLVRRINQIAESDLPLFEKIEGFCEEYITKILENPFIPLFVLNEVNKQPDVFVKKMWAGKKPLVGKFFQQVDSEMQKGTIKKSNPAHLFLNLLGMCIFPFASKPMFIYATGASEEQFRDLMEERKKEIPRFIIDSIKK